MFRSAFPFSYWNKAYSIPNFPIPDMQKAAIFRAARFYQSRLSTIYLDWFSLLTANYSFREQVKLE